MNSFKGRWIEGLDHCTAGKRIESTQKERECREMEETVENGERM
jgi:hypothetical protein